MKIWNNLPFQYQYKNFELERDNIAGDVLKFLSCR